MSMEQQEVIVKGPMHPDLFGGETPTTVRMPVSLALRVFRVDVQLVSEETVEVVARDTEEAMAIAERLVDAGEYSGGHDVEAAHARSLQRPPTDAEIQEYLEDDYQEVRS